MLKFLAGAFAIAGLIAASGPIIIHLLNRRRFKVVEWGAMHFLRQAMQRNRRVLNLRDLILLVLRCLAVAIFGAGLARPFVSGVSTLMIFGIVLVGLAVVTAIAAGAASILTSQPKVRRTALMTCVGAVLLSVIGLFTMVRERDQSTTAALSGRQPVHAIIVLDNSLSMGYELLNGTLLTQAKVKAVEFIDALPAGSQIHLIPLCGTEEAAAGNAYRNKTDARAALDRVNVVDRIGRASIGLQLAAEAARQVPELDTKRVVLISDQQKALWEGGAAKQLADLKDVQILRISAERTENVWVSKFHLQDGVADTQTPAVFLATIQHAGDQPLANVKVALTIDGIEVASRLVDLEPGQAREIEFKQRLDISDTSGLSEGLEAAAFVKASVSVTVEAGIGDRLARDNVRHLVVPVVSGLPVVFVDQYGQEENLDRNEVGETYRLRRLLAPRTSTDDEQNRQLVRVRHVSIERLNEELLSDARLVVIAGVTSPGEAAPLLRQYALQGGSVVIAAGADFDSNAWSQAGWKDGASILPAPLQLEPIGQLPGDVPADRLETFTLDFKSLHHDFFQIEGEPADSLEDLYRSPVFFKAAVADVSNTTLDAMVAAQVRQIVEAREFVQQSDARRKAWDEKERQGALTEAEATERRADDNRRNEVRPTWLKWLSDDAQLKLDEISPQELAMQTRPRVLARYSPNGVPFLVERRIGVGRVFFVSTGLYSSWSTLTSTNAILLFDRMLRQLLEETLPKRNFETGAVVTLPAQKSDRLRWEVQSPAERREPLTIEALSENRYGVLVRRALQQGFYDVLGTDMSSEEAARQPKTRTALAFHCPPEESELAAFDAIAFRERMGEGTYRWLERDDVLSVEGAQIRGRNLWKWLIIAVFLCLLAEMLILAWPYRKTELDPQAA